MNNFTSMVIAILEKSKLLTEAEAEKLAKELHMTTLPDNYKECAKLLDDLYKKFDIKTLDHKINKAVKAKPDIIG